MQSSLARMRKRVNEMCFKIILQLHKKGSSSTTVQSYQPTEQEKRLQKQAADYSEAVAPNALKLNDAAYDLLFGNLGDMQQDYQSMLADAQQQATAAQQGVAGLTAGQLPQAYIDNMQQIVSSGVENSLGSAMSNLAGRGVLSSSVANNAINNISQNAANTMAQQFQNNIGTLNGLYGQQAALAGQNMTLAAAAQEAAQQPALNLWNASLGLNSGGTLGALGVIGGQGTTTTTGSTSGGGGLFGGLLTGAATGYASGLACFADDVKIKTPNGERFIRLIREGEPVITYDPETGEEAENKVLFVQEPVYKDTFAVVCMMPDGKKNVVYTTLPQPLLTEDGEWVEVSMLRINTPLKNVGKVVSLAYSGERKVYDFQVENTNSYFANGFVAKGAYDNQKPKGK